MSLTHPHPLWTTASASPYEVLKARVQATMLSGRYRTERLCRFWSRNKRGFCLAPSCQGLNIPEDLEHILVHCQSLEPARLHLNTFTYNFSLSQHPTIQHILNSLSIPGNDQFVQFLLDCSALPSVISTVQSLVSQTLTPLFHVSRTWCYVIHRERLKILGRWRKF